MKERRRVGLRTRRGICLTALCRAGRVLIRAGWFCAIDRLPFEDVWKMFGDGVHPKFEQLLDREIAPFLSQGAANFW